MTTTNFNVTPYYDDFDEDKNFYRILFQPGRAVQARELTQSQTILQDQVKKFGDHIFKDGSRVTGAEIFSVPEFGRKLENIENSQKPTARSVKLESTFESSSIDVSTFVNKYITTNTANVQLANVKNIYFVHHADPALGTDPDTLYVSYLRTTNLTIGGSTSNSTMELQKANTVIQNSANLQVFSTSDVAPANLLATVTTQSASAEGPAKLLGVDEGVFFTSGIFAKNQKQIIAVDKYGSNANVSVGFDVVENTISSTSDTSLLDPALDSSNYLAPGGDRLKISLTLTKKDLDSNNSLPSLQTNKYIELVRFRNGQLVKDTSGTKYADLGRTLARRTFDESGDYIVDGLEPRLTPLGNSSSFILNISKGKAYVKGYEIDKTNDITKLAIKRAQDQESVVGYDIPTAYGNFLHIHQSNNAIFNSNTSERILLHSSNTITNTLTQIGEAYVKNIEYVSGDGFDAVHKLHLFGVKRSGANNLPLSMTKSIVGAGLGQANANVELSSITTIQTSGTIADDNSNHIIVADSSQIRVGDEAFGHNLSAFTGITGEGERRVHVTAINGSNITLSAPNNGSSRKPYSKEIANTYTFQRAAIQDTNDTLSVFPAAYSTVASVNQIDYNTRRIFKTVSFTDGVASISTTDGTERFKAAGTAALKKELYAIMIRSGTTSDHKANHAVNMAESGVTISTPTPSEGSTATATIDIDDSSFDGTADILATLDVTDAGRRTKVANSFFTTFTRISNSSTQLHSLGVTDVTNVTGIFISPNTSYMPSDNANTNYLKHFTFDTGQRDSYYDHATIKIKPSAITSNILPKGMVNVTYARFTHTGLGHFDANSYPTYEEIPQYIENKGNKIELRDSIDFRPLRTENRSSNVYSNSAMTFTRNQIVDRRVGSADVDLSYYLSRIDKVVLGFDGQFRVIEGDSALNNPATPLDDPDSMTLYKLTFPPYTFQTSNVDIDIVKNKRYTMKDIGGIDDRLSRVEYYTALNLLESEVAGSTFFSNSNIELINNGFLVDDFKGHSIGDVLNDDYKCSIDYDNQILHPRFKANGTNTAIETGGGSLKNTGNVLTLPFTTQVYSAQNVASTSVNINPFNVVSFVGYVKLETDVTSYTDFDSRPIVVSNRDGNSDNYEFGVNFQGSVWSEWDLLSFNNDTTRKYTYYDKNGAKVSTTTSAEETSSQSTKTETDRIFYYMSAENIDFEIFGYRPNTEVHAFLDGKNVSDRLRAFNTTTNAFETAPKKCLIISDDQGFAKGRLVIPNNEAVNRQFAAGEHQIFFSDSIASPNVFSTFAETRYYSGTPKSRIIPPVVEVRNDPPAPVTPVSTECAFQEDDDKKTPNCQTVSEARAELPANGGAGDSDVTDATFGISEQIIRDTYSAVLGRKPDKAGMQYYMERIENGEIDAFTPGTLSASLTTIFEASPEAKAKNECPLGVDPLAQTFFVNEFTNPKGVFLTSVDVFFASKDSTLPVHFEIRKVLNGFPSETIIAKSRVSKNPDDIILPIDPNVPEPTRFTFDAPLFLEPDQYAMVLLSSSFEYNVYIATVGQNRLDTGQSIVGQPYLGSLFKSQNASTWTPAQESDLCFVIHQAQFDTTGAISSFIQPVQNLLPDQAFDLLRINAPFQTFSDKTNMSFKLGLKTEGQSDMDAGITTLPNSDTYLENRKEFKQNIDANLQIIMSSTNADVSPVFEQDRCRFVFVENLINSSANTEVVTRPETNASDGGASSKYITRKVTLGEGFDATALRVILAKNLPEGSSISVFYRVQSESDETTAFEDLPYVEMNKITQTPVNQNINEYYDCEFKAEDIIYSSAGVNFDSFRSFAIKIVFFSTNTAKAPTARNLRVIALSWQCTKWKNIQRFWEILDQKPYWIRI